MFKKLIKTYLLIFLLTFVIYSFLDWFVATHFEININTDYLNFWIPAVLCAIITYVYLRPIVKKLKYSEKASDFLLWFILPFTIWTPVAFSQDYFKDLSYKIITVDKPSDLYKHLNQRFFKIKTFKIVPENYFIMREQHISGKYGTTLNVSNYYVAPIYDDTSEIINQALTTIGYGISFTTSMHNGLFDKDQEPPKIKAFNKKSAEDYKNYNFYNVDYFEKIENTNDSKIFFDAINRNPSFDKSYKNLVLVNRSGTMKDLDKKGMNLFIYSTLIAIGICLITLFIVNEVAKEKHSS